MRTPEMTEIARLARTGGGFKNEGMLNVYRCTEAPGGALTLPGLPRRASCGHSTVTVDRERGVTSFIIACRKCGGEAHSSMYRVAQNLAPEWEWYRPDDMKDVPQVAREHVRKGGLLLREIAAAAPAPKPDPIPVGDTPKAKATRLSDLTDPDTRAAMEVMLPQLLLVLVERLGGDITVPAVEIDATGGKRLSMEVVPDLTGFRFVVTKSGGS